MDVPRRGAKHRVFLCRVTDAHHVVTVSQGEDQQLIHVNGTGVVEAERQGHVNHATLALNALQQLRGFLPRLILKKRVFVILIQKRVFLFSRQR